MDMTYHPSCSANKLDSGSLGGYRLSDADPWRALSTVVRESLSHRQGLPLNKNVSAMTPTPSHCAPTLNEQGWL
jgi:hypothetical protein